VNVTVLDRQASCREQVEASLDAIEETQRMFNAFTSAFPAG
jgi:hypothetical protein